MSSERPHNNKVAAVATASAAAGRPQPPRPTGSRTAIVHPPAARCRIGGEHGARPFDGNSEVAGGRFSFANRGFRAIRPVREA
jgi:hypothetical protein